MTRSLPPESGDEIVVRPTDEITVRPGEVPAVPVVDMPEPATGDPVQELHGRIIGTRAADRRAVVPDYLRTRQARRELYAFVAQYAAYAAAFHALRLPLYAGRLALRTPRGTVLVLAALMAWVFDAEGRPLRSATIARVSTSSSSSSEATREYLALTKVRNERVRRRGTVVLGVLGLVLVAYLFRVVQRWATTPTDADLPPLVPLPWWGWVLFYALTIGVLGWIGAPADRPIVTRAVLATLAPKPTAPIVERALRATGVGGMNAKEATISFPSEVARDGPGWRVDVDLPYGITVGEILDRREKLASGLRRPVSAVWPEADADQHAGRLIIWVGDQPLAKQKPKPWPLLDTGSVEILAQSFPFGSDPRGRKIPLMLGESNVLIGSLPGGGKTAAVRVLGCAAALDPHAELRIFEHKGSGDLGALERCCHRYVSGVADGDIEQTLITFRELVRELEKRAAIIKKLPRELVPDRKVTPALAKRSGLGLHPIVCIVDECQEVFTHPDYKAEAAVLAEKIIRRGRALGVILVLATQRPDANSLPTGVKASAGIRFCLRVMDQESNDSILGTSQYKNGIRATTLSPSEKGVGYLVGVGDSARVLRTYYLDDLAAEQVARRALAARIAAGTLTGHAIGDDEVVDPGPSVDLLADLWAILETHGNPEPRSGKGKGKGRWLWSETAVGALEVLRPDVYRGWDAASLGKALAAQGVPTTDMNRTDSDGERRNLIGLDEVGLRTVLDARGGVPEALEDASE